MSDQIPYPGDLHYSQNLVGCPPTPLPLLVLDTDKCIKYSFLGGKMLHVFSGIEPTQ